jgi:hypothetical protein
MDQNWYSTDLMTQKKELDQIPQNYRCNLLCPAQPKKKSDRQVVFF